MIAFCCLPDFKENTPMAVTNNVKNTVNVIYFTLPMITQDLLNSYIKLTIESLVFKTIKEKN
jgi:hypothetical protein